MTGSTSMVAIVAGAGTSSRIGALKHPAGFGLRDAVTSRGVTTVLLVDDDGAYRSSLAAFLSASFDIAVVGQTGDGREAIRFAEERRPDAVVVDLAMPGVGGLEVASAIGGVLPQAVVVVVTGAAEVSEDVRARHPTVSAWLRKGDPLVVENALRTLTRGRP